MLKNLKAFAILLIAATAVTAQGPKITRVSVGFSGYFRSSQWAPIVIELQGGNEHSDPKLLLEGRDADGAEHLTGVQLNLAPGETQKLVKNFKGVAAAGQGPADWLRVRFEGGANAAIADKSGGQLDEKQFLLVVLGGRVPALETLVQRERDAGDADAKKNPSSLAHWHIGRESDVETLPNQWFAYQAADAVLLNVGGRLLEDLAKHPVKFAALASWVRQGGKLIVAVDPKQAAPAREIFKLWKLTLPLGNAERPLELARSTNDWGLAKLFPGPLHTASFDARGWEVWSQFQDGERNVPLVARTSYGFGTVTVLPFSLDGLAPSAEGNEKDHVAFFTNLLARQRERSKEEPGDSIAARLNRDLGQFDVPLVPFQWIALCILLYILAVGPLEYFLLKRMNRLEWTWVTFPLTIAPACGLAYYFADRLMTHELQVNKIDLIDIDLRSEMRPYCAGQSYVSVLTPGLQNLDVGIEIAEAKMDGPAFWSRPLVTWLGRSEQEFRSGGANFFKRPYDVDPQRPRLSGIGMNVRTSKSFLSAWESGSDKPPLVCKLTYPVRETDQVGVKLQGTIRNELAVELVDAWLIYDTFAYPLPASLPIGKDVAVKIDLTRGQRLPAWMELPDPASAFPNKKNFSAAQTVKRLAFFDQAPAGSNAGFAPLDWSWHLRAAPQLGEKTQAEAILYARAKTLPGDAEKSLFEQLNLPPAIRLQPVQPAKLTQEIYVRVLIPVIPADEP